MPRTNKPADSSSDSLKPARTPKRRNGAAESLNGPDAVARRAYEIYESRGGDHGADLDDWLEAERQLKPGPTDVTGPTAPAPPKSRRRKGAEGTV